MACEVCKSEGSLFEIHGDMTCVKCGVVTMIRMVDDTYYSNYTQDNNVEDTIQIPTRQIPTKIAKWAHQSHLKSMNAMKTGEMKDILVNKMLMDEQFIETSCEWYEIAIEKGKVYDCKQKRIQNEIFVCCAYCVSIYLKRGIDIIRFCDAYNTKKKRVMGVLFQVCEKWKGNHWYKQLMKDMTLMAGVERLKRCVYELSIEKEKQWDIIKNAEKIYKRVRFSAKLQKVRTKSLNATCVYIACKINKIKIKKEIFSKETDTSIPTLNVTELLIQEALNTN